MTSHRRRSRLSRKSPAATAAAAHRKGTAIAVSFVPSASKVKIVSVTAGLRVGFVAVTTKKPSSTHAHNNKSNTPASHATGSTLAGKTMNMAAARHDWSLGTPARIAHRNTSHALNPWSEMFTRCSAIGNSRPSTNLLKTHHSVSGTGRQNSHPPLKTSPLDARESRTKSSDSRPREIAEKNVAMDANRQAGNTSQMGNRPGVGRADGALGRLIKANATTRPTKTKLADSTCRRSTPSSRRT